MYPNRFKGFRLHLILFTFAAGVLGGVPFALAGFSAAASESGSEGAENLEAEVQEHLDNAQKLLDRILAVDGRRTVKNTLTLMNSMSIELDAASNKCQLIENVHPDPEMRETAEKGTQAVQSFVTELSLNRDLYDALGSVNISNAKSLTKRLVKRGLRDYRRSGVDKDEATREQIKTLNEEIVEIGQDWSRNIREDVRHIYLDSADDLAGLPQDYIDDHQPDETGKIKINTQYPDYLPFMDYAENNTARKELYEAFNNRAYPQNEEVLMTLLAKREKLANLLGFETWADYITEDKMIGSQERAAEFIEQIKEASRERAAADLAMLLERKRKDDPTAVRVEDYEKTYYGELVKEEQFEFDSQEIRNYFSYPAVRQGILDITAKMFGVTYTRLKDAEVWHPTVEAFEIFEGDKLLGRFYLDMHPRDGKFGHAAAFPLRGGVNGQQVPTAALVCNFPGGDGDGPALMVHGQVETFLHEFGHLLHYIFGGHHDWIDFSGFQTEWDFVEAPSQMLEEWALDTKTLQTFARHHQTGEPIPADLAAKLRAAKSFGNGTWVTQQTFYTALSLNIYNRPASEVDLDAIMLEMQTRYGSFEHVSGTHKYASFGHLDGYSAMYYTYLWSLVIAKDMFSMFDPENLLDPKTAKKYRDRVLAPGGSKDARDLVKNFLGREYSFEAFRNWLNNGAS